MHLQHGGNFYLMESVAVSIPCWKEAAFQGSEGKLKFRSPSENIWFWFGFLFFLSFIMTGASSNL